MTGDLNLENGFDYAEQLLFAGRYEEGLTVASVALLASPDDFVGRSTKGQLLKQLGRLDEACTEYLTAITIAQATAVDWTEVEELRYFCANIFEMLGAIYWDQALVSQGRSDWELAKSTFEKAIELDDTNFRAWFGIGLCQSRLGNPQSAIDSVECAVSIEPLFVEAHACLFQFQLSRLHLRDAIHSLKAVIRTIDQKVP